MQAWLLFTSRTQQRILRNTGDCWKSGTAWRGLQPRFQRFAVILVQTITLIDFLPPPQNSQDRLNCQATDASLFSKTQSEGSLSCIDTTAWEQKCSNNMPACLHVCVHEYVGAFLFWPWCKFLWQRLRQQRSLMSSSSSNSLTRALGRLLSACRWIHVRAHVHEREEWNNENSNSLIFLWQVQDVQDRMIWWEREDRVHNGAVMVSTPEESAWLFCCQCSEPLCFCSESHCSRLNATFNCLNFPGPAKGRLECRLHHHVLKISHWLYFELRLQRQMMNYKRMQMIGSAGQIGRGAFWNARSNTNNEYKVKLWGILCIFKASLTPPGRRNRP